MGWNIIGILAFLIIIIIIGVSFRRVCNHNYRIGSGMFKNSENNLDDKTELSDMEYYDKDGLMK